ERRLTTAASCNLRSPSNGRNFHAPSSSTCVMSKTDCWRAAIAFVVKPQHSALTRVLLISSGMPCVGERRTLSNAVVAAFAISSRDDPFVIPGNNCHCKIVGVPATHKFKKLSLGVLYQLGRYLH